MNTVTKGWYWPALLLLGALGVVAALLSTPYGGAGTTPDSISYIAASRSLLAGYGFVRYEAVPFTIWPPVYPLLLAGVDVIRSALGIVDITEAIRYGQALGFGALIVAAGVLFRRGLGESALALIAAGFVLASFALLRMAIFTWNELSYTLLSVFFLLAMCRLLAWPGPALLLLVTVLAATGAMIRYAGVGLIAAGGVMLLLGLWGQPLRRYIAYLAVYSASIIPYGLWYLYNRQSETSLRDQGDPWAALLLNLQLTGDLLSEWLLPEALWGPVGGLLLGALIVAAAGLALWAGWGRGGIETVGWVPPLVALYLLVYLAIFYASHMLINTTPVDHRHLGVLYPFILFMLLWAGQCAARRIGGGRVRAALLIGAAAWLLIPAARQVAEMRYFAQYCCEAEGYRRDPLVEWIAANPTDGYFYSNVPLPLLYTDALQYRVPQQLEAFFWFDPARPLYLVWFDQPAAYSGSPRFVFEMPFTPAELESIAEVTLIAETPTGRIYRLTPP